VIVTRMRPATATDCSQVMALSVLLLR
jgi:hypothetical protein